jgi:multiple sugar transport system permease protein
MSLNDWPELGHPHFIGLTNFSHLVQDSQFLHALRFTFEFTFAVTTLLMVTGFALALMMQHQRPGIGAFRTAIVVPVAIGFAAGSYLWLALLNPSVGIVDNLLMDLHILSQPINWFADSTLALIVVALVTTWKSAGFSMIALMNGLQGIPDEVEEAARIDGAGKVRMLFLIRLPLIRPSISFALTFVSVSSLLTFDQFYILTNGGPGGETSTVVYQIYNVAFVQQALGYAAAMSIAFLVILLLITSLQLALLRRGFDQ